jgi:hypothetical protein
LATGNLETENAAATIEPSNTPSDPPSAPQPEPAMHSTEPATETATPATTEPEVQPAMPEPLMIELVSNPPPDELGGTVAEHGSA